LKFFILFVLHLKSPATNVYFFFFHKHKKRK
jgi:hypothetical protein